jgi:hypothetical protein
MHLLEYNQQWADVIVSQIATSRGSRLTETWGYACLVLNKDIEKIVEENYEEIDFISGKYLHVFALIPPSQNWIAERYNKILRSKESADKQYLIEIFQRLLNRNSPPDKRTQITEKVRLLKELQECGFEPDMYADFLFFDFRNTDDDVDIDVIAAKTTSISNYGDAREVKSCFQKMSQIAEISYSKNYSADQFVKELTWEWGIKVSLKKGLEIWEYISKFKSFLGK